MYGIAVQCVVPITLTDRYFRISGGSGVVSVAVPFESSFDKSELAIKVIFATTYKFQLFFLAKSRQHCLNKFALFLVYGANGGRYLPIVIVAARITLEEVLYTGNRFFVKARFLFAVFLGSSFAFCFRMACFCFSFPHSIVWFLVLYCGGRYLPAYLSPRILR